MTTEPDPDDRDEGAIKVDGTLEAIGTLTNAGDFQAAYLLAVPFAEPHELDAKAQLLAAYACDRAGYEQHALVFYQRAWDLGVPLEPRFHFLIGYSSTLKNVGRAAESLQWLREAGKRPPGHPAPAAFTALSLHSVGETAQALATMLDAALKTEGGNGLAPYTRALTEYRNSFLAETGRVEFAIPPVKPRNS
ncbi:tetratricopeptide repeat protein [Pseudomonas sp. LP_7_YM]|uniref:tetratricopeptide repeat protein n=1 Tax=Pseudomonas sp. LP_7_YM TaxID=2485137 RepID=UPI00105F9187|nr:tetratricopeptide repeat protein [Pseudomonas sp. LP_7_YM]TDV72526.1 tetratricopeptide repeat protein [Pseudomonas sp. LP_7_YM]